MLSTKEISEMLKVSEETVRRWIRTGELEATQDGKSYQIDKNWLEDFIQKKSIIPGTSLAKMQSLFEGIIGNPKTKETASELFSKGIGKFMKGDFFSEAESVRESEPEPEDIEGHIESLNRQKKKLELEHQIKIIDLEDKIARYERILRNQNK